MPLMLDKVHEHEIEEGSNRMILVRTNPYARFICKDQPPVICQKGNFYSDGGDRIKRLDVPKWVWDSAKHMTPEGRSNIGLVLEEEAGPNLPDREESEASAQNSGTQEKRPPDLIETVYSLNFEDDAHWTKGGLPNLSVLKDYMNRYVSRGEVDDTCPGYNREIAGNR